jgi:hypothetical protein
MGTDGRSMMLVLRAYLDGASREASDRQAGQIAEFIIEKAMSGRFGYFTLVLDMVDGKLHRTADDEMTFEAGSVPVAADEGWATETAKAA